MTSLVELTKSGIINISCKDVLKLLIADIKLAKILIKVIINNESLSLIYKTEQIVNLISVRNENIHKLCDKIIGKYLPMIIKAAMNNDLVSDDYNDIDQMKLVNIMINYVIENNMCDVIDDIVQIVYDTYQSKNEIPKFLVAIIINENKNFRRMLLSKLFELDNPENNSLICSKKDLLFCNIISMLYKYLPNEYEHSDNSTDSINSTEIIKEHIYEYVDKYVDIFELFLQNNYVTAKCVCFVISDMILHSIKKSNITSNIIISNILTSNIITNTFNFAKKIYDYFDKQIRRQIASKLFCCYRAHKSCILNDNRKHTYFDMMIRIFLNDMTDEMIYKLILNMHGGLSHISMFSKKYNSITCELFRIEIIDIIQKYFPEHFKKLIVNELFKHHLDMFPYVTSDTKKILIEYTDYLNKLGYLPYDKICGNNMIKKTENSLVDESSITINQDILCPGCLIDTLWIIKECGHSLCRECYVSRIYCKEYISCDVNNIDINDICIICSSLKQIKTIDNNFNDDDDDEDTDDDSDSD